MLIDSHCHLDFPEYQGKIDEVIKEAANNNVQLMQTICTHISRFPNIIAIAESFPNIYASVGIHPHNVDDEYVTLEQLIEFTKHKKVIGIGETGLDYYYEHGDRNKQKSSFITHIKASQQTSLPIIVHTRDADDDTISIIKEQYQNLPFPGLIHCFTSSQKLADEVLALGFYISISGIITFKNAIELQNTVKNIPLERLIIETDSPFLAPIPHRGKVNQPAYVKYVAAKIAELKEIAITEVEETTTKNFFDLFSKVRSS